MSAKGEPGLDPRWVLMVRCTCPIWHHVPVWTSASNRWRAAGMANCLKIPSSLSRWTACGSPSCFVIVHSTSWKPSGSTTPMSSSLTRWWNAFRKSTYKVVCDHPLVWAIALKVRIVMLPNATSWWGNPPNSPWGLCSTRCGINLERSKEWNRLASVGSNMIWR